MALSLFRLPPKVLLDVYFPRRVNLSLRLRLGKALSSLQSTDMNPVQSPAGHRRTNAVDRGLMFEMLSSTALWVPARSAAE